VSALPKTDLDVPPSTHLHRRRQRVVVRRNTSLTVTSLQSDRRGRVPTLTGLGARDAQDTLPDWIEALVDLTDETICEDDSPISQIRRRIPPAAAVPRLSISSTPPPPPSSRARPVTLLDDVDDERARGYLDEARRLIESGVFDPETAVTLVS
jgi:hypothetical protein